MNIKNHTSSVPVEKSVMLIEHQLSCAGASTISKWYDENKDLAGISFQIMTNGVPVVFRLPSKWKECEKVFVRQISRPNETKLRNARQQAQRTAWKILFEWVQIQVSLIELQQAEVLEVFLPYAYDPAKDMTFFDRVKEGGFKMLTTGGPR